MSHAVALGFPILDRDSGGFANGVHYTVEATIRGNAIPRVLELEHCLTGKSFIRQWIQAKEASFSTRLLFRESAHRQVHRFDGEYEITGDRIIAKQRIPVHFSYQPEIACSIIASKDLELIVSHPDCGLSVFWQAGQRMKVPKYARIGRHPDLVFEDGSLPSLIRIVPDESLENGQMKTIVSETAGPGEKPVTLICAKDVFDELHAFRDTWVSNSREAMQASIITQALCALYGYMWGKYRGRNDGNQVEDADEDINRALLLHRDYLRERTLTDWRDEDFDARPCGRIDSGLVFGIPGEDFV